MARRPLPPIKKFALIVGILIAVECVFLVIFHQASPGTPKQAIATAADKFGGGLDAQRREQLKVQLAVQLYQSKNRGRPPATLNELVPAYFDTLPLDPETGQPFEYKVAGNRVTIGKEQDHTAAAASAESATASLISVPEEDPEKARYVYDPTGKRDPFRPFDFSPKKGDEAGKTPLEKYDLGQLKLTAVLGGFDEPIAMVENSAGKGFPVKKGTKIGLNGGEVVEIQPDKVIVVETVTDFTGESKSTTHEIKLRAKDVDAPKQ
jgi:type IV pilus assembly protein PilP